MDAEDIEVEESLKRALKKIIEELDENEEGRDNLNGKKHLLINNFYKICVNHNIPIFIAHWLLDDFLPVDNDGY